MNRGGGLDSSRALLGTCPLRGRVIRADSGPGVYNRPMSKEGTLFTVGVLVMLAPFAGLPMSWLEWLLPIFGAIIIIAAYLVRQERAAPPAPLPPPMPRALPDEAAAPHEPSALG